jgi:hypothetical protein
MSVEQTFQVYLKFDDIKSSQFFKSIDNQHATYPLEASNCDGERSLSFLLRFMDLSQVFLQNFFSFYDVNVSLKMFLYLSKAVGVKHFDVVGTEKF